MQSNEFLACNVGTPVIMDMSKIESGKFAIDDIRYNLPKLLQELWQMLAVRAQDAGVRFSVEILYEERMLLNGDPQRIHQILTNLVGNAIKFSPQGTVILTSFVEDGWLLFKVKDNGIGMNGDEVGRLFQRFEQASSTTSRRFGGSGLGLYISRNLAEMMNGKISVESEKGVGSTFTLHIPYRPSDVEIKSAGDELEDSEQEPVELSGTVLVAEDTPALQLLERRILESMGLTVIAANNGIEAVERSVNQPLDLILMDMQMPMMNGLDATRKLRSEGVEIPIIALTANVLTKHQEEYREAGCDGFVAKPIDRKELRKVLERYLKPAR